MAVASLTDEDVREIIKLSKDERIGDRVRQRPYSIHLRRNKLSLTFHVSHFTFQFSLKFSLHAIVEVSLVNVTNLSRQSVAGAFQNNFS